GPVAEVRGDMNFTMDSNCYYDTRGEDALLFPDGMTLSQWQEKGFDRNSVIANPGFRDIAHGDLSFDQRAPPLAAIGFMPLDIPLPIIGAPRPDRAADERTAALFDLPRRGGTAVVSQVRFAADGSALPPADGGNASEHLLAWWQFNGTEKASSPMSGALSIGARIADGMIGNALLLDGAGGRMDVKAHRSLALLESMTVCAWVRPLAEQRYKRGAGVDVHAGIIESAGQSWRLTIVENAAPYSVKFGVNFKGLKEIASQRTIPADAWTFVAGIYDAEAGELRVAVNGTTAARIPLPPAAKIRTENTITIGARDQRSYFGGAIDELRIYGAALSDGSLAELAARKK
ncbi:MAG: LamG domain-containing protein, partial [Spirochaetota bacterium]